MNMLRFMPKLDSRTKDVILDWVFADEKRITERELPLTPIDKIEVVLIDYLNVPIIGRKNPHICPCETCQNIRKFLKLLEDAKCQTSKATKSETPGL